MYVKSTQTVIFYTFKVHIYRFGTVVMRTPVGFGCADGKDRALQCKCPFVGFSCSSKGYAPLQPSQAGDREGSYGQFNPNTT